MSALTTCDAPTAAEDETAQPNVAACAGRAIRGALTSATTSNGHVS